MDWLINSHAGLTNELIKFRFLGEFDKELVGDDFSDVTSIKVCDPSRLDINESLFNGTTTGVEKKSSWIADIADVVSKVIKSAPLADETYEKLSSSRKIKVDIGFKFEQQTKRGDASGIGELLELLRDVPDDMIEINTKHRVQKAGKVRLQTAEDIATVYEGNSIDINHAAKCMLMYYISLVNQNKIISA